MAGAKLICLSTKYKFMYKEVMSSSSKRNILNDSNMYCSKIDLEETRKREVWTLLLQDYFIG